MLSDGMSGQVCRRCVVEFTYIGKQMAPLAMVDWVMGFWNLLLDKVAQVTALCEVH